MYRHSARAPFEPQARTVGAGGIGPLTAGLIGAGLGYLGGEILDGPDGGYGYPGSPGLGGYGYQGAPGYGYQGLPGYGSYGGYQGAPGFGGYGYPGAAGFGGYTGLQGAAGFGGGYGYPGGGYGSPGYGYRPGLF